MSEAKFSLPVRLRRASALLRDVETASLFPNMTAAFLGDDNLFMRELFRCFHPNLFYDLARSVKGEVCSEMHSSRVSGCLPKGRQPFVASGTMIQDRRAEPTLRPSVCVPMPGQLALRGGLGTIGVI